ncbi:MAG TPA: glycosyl hydrolase family 18 protein [Chloroflexota bacterium]|nr:glycosyl hydrolase family 18 protein [Chloroflexota bacterium]
MTRLVPLLVAVPVFAGVVLASGVLGLGSPAGTADQAVPVAAQAAQPSSTPVPAAAPTFVPAPAATPKPAASTQRASDGGKKVVVGYYVPYDTTSWTSLQNQADSLDYVDTQWVNVDACGNVGSRDDNTLIAYARDKGVKVLPSLLTGSDWLNHRLLTNPAIADRYLSQIVSYVVEMGYPGFDLDMENIGDADRDAYSTFVAKLADALHQRGKILTLAIPAKTTDVRTGWAGPYDYAALGKSADLILLMTDDYSWSTGPAGSIAPKDWVDKVAAYAVSQMPLEKVLVGLAFYGYDWNKTQAGTKARGLQYAQSVAIAKQHGAQITTDPTTGSATFSYTARAGEMVPNTSPPADSKHDISVRQLGQCAVQEPAAPSPKPTPTPVPVQERTVWLEDAAAVASKLDVAVKRNVGGVGSWRLGQEDPAVWPLLARYRSGTATPGK